MNKRLETAFELVRALPDDRQDEIAALILDILGEEGSDVVLTPEQIDEIERRIEEDDVATDEEVNAFFERLKA